MDRMLQYEQRMIRIHWFHSSSSSPLQGLQLAAAAAFGLRSLRRPRLLPSPATSFRRRTSPLVVSVLLLRYSGLVRPGEIYQFGVWIGLFLLVTNPSLLGLNNTMEVRPMVALRAALVGGVAAFAKIGAAMKAAGGAKVGAAAAAMTAAATAAVSGKDTNKDNPKTETK
uniref:Uncharacterized protein n=1 Tax=Oryza punctata TaxID=4537 RepID=A0A0E0L7W1_ORYPU